MVPIASYYVCSLTLFSFNCSLTKFQVDKLFRILFLCVCNETNYLYLLTEKPMSNERGYTNFLLFRRTKKIKINLNKKIEY